MVSLGAFVGVVKIDNGIASAVQSQLRSGVGEVADQFLLLWSEWRGLLAGLGC